MSLQRDESYSGNVVLTLVHFAPRQPSSADAAALVADYLAFDRQRQQRRLYGKALGGLAVVALLGGVAGKLPLRQADIAAAILLLPPLALRAIEGYRWYRLLRRLDRVRAEVRDGRKS